MAKRRKSGTAASEFVKRDGALALTFVNTVAQRRTPLSSYADLLAWSRLHASQSPADHEKPPPEAVGTLNAYLVHTVPPRRIVASEAGFRLGWATGRKDDLGRPLWAVILSATSANLSAWNRQVVKRFGSATPTRAGT